MENEICKSCGKPMLSKFQKGGQASGDEGQKGCFSIVWYNTLQFTGHF